MLLINSESSLELEKSNLKVLIMFIVIRQAQFRNPSPLQKIKNKIMIDVRLKP